MKALLFLGKFVVIFAFIANTGIFSEIRRISSIDSKREITNDPARIKDVQDFCNKRYTAAQEKIARGEKYSPFDYFIDLRDINILEDSLKTNFAITMPNGINALQEFSLRYIRNGESRRWQVEEAREKIYNPYLRKIGKLVDPNARDLAWQTVLSKIGIWLLGQYLKGFPLALLLFFIWIIRDNEWGKKKLRLRNPISFIISLVLYPVVLAVVLRRWWKEVGRSLYAEIELRRTKEKFFSILSKDEIAAVKRFAESNLKLSEWKKELLGQGLTFRRSFVLGAVSLIVCFILFGINRAHGEEKISKPTYSMSVMYGSSGGIEMKSFSSVSQDVSSNAILEDDVIWFAEAIQFVIEERVRVLFGHMKSVEHVPVSRLANHFINDLLTKKGNEHENDILHIISISASLRCCSN